MKKKILILIFIFIIFILLTIFFVTKDLKIERNLNKELIELTILVNKNNYLENKDTIQNKLTTYTSKQDYLIVETCYKNYLLDILNEKINLDKLISNDKFTKILSVENIINDGKDFIQSKKYIIETRTSLNETIKNLINLYSYDKIMSYIENKKLNNYYINYYKNIFYHETVQTQIKEKKDKLQEKLDKYNNILNIYDEALNYLIENSNNYEIKDNLIYFKTDELNNKYNEIINKLK